MPHIPDGAVTISVQTRYKSTPQVVGYIDGFAFVRTDISKELHRMRKFKGYAVDVRAIERARELGCTYVRLECLDGDILSATFEIIKKHGKRINFRGHGEQLVLHEKRWAKGAEPHPVQQDLF
jgi:hypothetical protein